VPRFSANITTLFREVQFIERIGLAAAAGFDAIEIQFPYDQDPAVLRDELQDTKPAARIDELPGRRPDGRR